MTYIYLAHPIDQVPDDMGEWLEGLIESAVWALRDQNVWVYHPQGAWKGTGDPDPIIDSINGLALGQAVGMLAILPGGIATIGTPMEILRAAELDMPVAVVTNITSNSLATMVSRQATVRLFDLTEMEEAAKWLTQSDSST